MHLRSSRCKALCLALPLTLALTLALLPARAVSTETIRFTPKVGYPTFAKREPVLRLKPGEHRRNQFALGRVVRKSGAARAR